MIASKLPMSEFEKFDFPRLKLTDIQGYELMDDEKVTEMMIN